MFVRFKIKHKAVIDIFLKGIISYLSNFIQFFNLISYFILFYDWQKF